MIRRSKAPRIGSVILCLSLLAGCSASQPTSFYTLSGFTAVSQPTAAEPIRLGVGPVSLPAYLDRPQVVIRKGANQMTVADFDQWAEPLETTFLRVLTQNLSSQLLTDQVLTLPTRRDIPLDHQIEIEVIRFDADDTGEAVLDARWWIFEGLGVRLQDSGRSVIRRQSAVDDDYKSIAKAMSDCLQVMSVEIAGALTAL